MSVNSHESILIERSSHQGVVLSATVGVFAAMPNSDPDTKPNTAPMTYRDAGVDIDAGNQLVRAIAPLAAATARPGAGAELGGFGGLFDLKAAGYTDPVLVAANDGVGTKVKIAIETGIHDTVGIDLVAMCVNDLIVQGAEPLFFLDYFSSAHLDLKVATDVVKGIADGCALAGCALIGGETAEMPGLYQDGDYDLAGFSVGAAERGTLLPRGDMAVGDVILGLASSGVHSNGYSLVRHMVSERMLDWNDPAPFDSSKSLGEALITPTRIYVKSVLAALKSDAVKALAHITGGGLTENLPRVLPKGMGANIDLASIDVPPVFQWLAQDGKITESEMLRTFNCGVGMALIVTPDKVNEVSDILRGNGEKVFKLGHLVNLAGDDIVQFSGALKV